MIATDAWTPQVNGVVTVLENLITRLEQQGFEVVIIHPGLFFSVPSYLKITRDVRLSTPNLWKLHSMIKREKPDYIHIVTEGPIGIATRALCVQKKLRFTTSYHTNFHQYAKARIGAFSDPVYKYVRWFHGRAEHTMVASQNLKEELEESGFKNIVLWPLGVDAEKFKRNPSAVMPKNIKPPVFVYAGRIAKEKNVEAFLKCDLPGTKLVIGDGPIRKELQKRFPDAVFAGFKKNQELIDLLSVSDVCVFPSKTETLGLVVLEALACELPVAAYPVIGPKDLITNGIDGYLDDSLEYAAKACLQLDRATCRKKALEFTWKRSAETFIRHLVSARRESIRSL